MKHFRDFNKAELKYVSSFKTGELAADRGATILREGSHSAHLFTMLSGWAFRYKLLEDGRRQILNYVMPGDLVGLQGTLLGEMQHSIETLSAVKLCVFERDQLDELFRQHPTLAYDITWIAAREERVLDEHLVSLGRRNAVERAAYLLAFLQIRGNAVGLGENGLVTLPITQQHIADTLGFSIVHTNRTLRSLVRRGYLTTLDRGCEVQDVEALLEISGWDGKLSARRPFI